MSAFISYFYCKNQGIFWSHKCLTSRKYVEYFLKIDHYTSQCNNEFDMTMEKGLHREMQNKPKQNKNFLWYFYIIQDFYIIEDFFSILTLIEMPIPLFFLILRNFQLSALPLLKAHINLYFYHLKKLVYCILENCH